MNSMNRRNFLESAAGAAGLLALGVHARADSANPYAPFRVGIATHTLRNFKTLDDCLAKLEKGSFGLKYSEFTKIHLPATTDAAKIKEEKEKFAAAGIAPLAICVHEFNEDPGNNRKIFEFAHALEVPTITATFSRKGALSLDKLCDEFPAIKVGIHNHGPEDKYKYASPEDVLECVKDRHKNIGATADLGHYIRSKQDPLDVIEKLKDRLYGVHFKDYKAGANGKMQETIPGDGTLKIKEVLALLKKVNFQGCLSLEYEQNPANPMADLKVALERIEKAAKEI